MISLIQVLVEQQPALHGLPLGFLMRYPTPIEIAQLSVAVLGSLCSLFWVVSAGRARTLILRETRRERDSRINGGLELMATGNLRQELLRFMTHLLVLHFGYLRLHLPAFEAPYATLGIELRVVLMLLTSSLFLMGLFEWSDRRALDIHDRELTRETQLRADITQQVAASVAPAAPTSAVAPVPAAERAADAQERAADAHERAADSQVQAAETQSKAAETQERAAEKRVK